MHCRDEFAHLVVHDDFGLRGQISRCHAVRQRHGAIERRNRLFQSQPDGSRYRYGGQQQHDGHRQPGGGLCMCVGALGLARLGGTQVRQQFFERGSGRPIHAFGGAIASGIVVVGGLIGCKGIFVTCLGRRNFAVQLGDQLFGFIFLRQLDFQCLDVLMGLGHGLLVGIPILLQTGRVLATQQHVFPLLNGNGKVSGHLSAFLAGRDMLHHMGFKFGDGSVEPVNAEQGTRQYQNRPSGKTHWNSDTHLHRRHPVNGWSHRTNRLAMAPMTA